MTRDSFYSTLSITAGLYVMLTGQNRYWWCNLSWSVCLAPRTRISFFSVMEVQYEVYISNH